MVERVAHFIRRLFFGHLGGRKGESGQHLALLAVSLPLLIAATGLLIDGGRLMIEYRRAQVAIDSAAFAAAQRVDRNVFFQTQQVVLQPGEALAIGGLYGSINSRGSVRVTSIEVVGDRVVARGVFDLDTIFLKMFGYGGVQREITSVAVPAFGIVHEDQ